ncbi:hypothetical protein I3843_04G124800 [Carya illinoinensis]|nr:hypothetical protein I3843_04G124800 [Carya illinoinensis]
MKKNPLSLPLVHPLPFRPNRKATLKSVHQNGPKPLETLDFFFQIFRAQFGFFMFILFGTVRFSREIFIHPRKRMRNSILFRKSKSSKSAAGDTDDDCVILEGDTENPVSVVDDAVGGSDELHVVGEKGQVTGCLETSWECKRKLHAFFF